MIYDLRAGIAFIHIPRTAGVAITTALRDRLPEPAVDTVMQRHMRAVDLKLLLGDSWERLYRFAVIRNPWEIVASDWRLTIGSLADLRLLHLPSAWRDRLTRAERDRGFERFVREEYLGDFCGLAAGGFWRTWCLDADGRDLAVDVWRFEDLPRRWIALCDCLELEISLDHLNATDVPREKTPWTTALIDAVGELCCEDCSRFGYRFAEN
jgi:hypothetical protein